MSHLYTWDKLTKNATRLNPKSRGKNYPYVPKWETMGILPFAGTNSCLVQLSAWGVTQGPSHHNVTLLFGDCDILTGEQDLSLREFFKVRYKDEIYYIKKFDRFRNPLTTRCTCFTADTKVKLGNDTWIPISYLVNSMASVRCYDIENNQFLNSIATNCNIKMKNTTIIKLYFHNGGTIRCTPDHKFLNIENEWVEARNLLGQYVHTDVEPLRITRIEEAGNEDVYCMNVDIYHNFLVESNGVGICVSNCKDYFFTWAFYNYTNGHCLYGPAPRPYQRKTTWMPPRNPLHTPGICKHIYHAWDYLRYNGYTIN